VSDSKWTEKRIRRIVASHYGVNKNTILPNYAIGTTGFEADLLVIRPSMWAEEIEIKCSVEDFRAEFKSKCRKHRILVEGKPVWRRQPHYIRDHTPDQWKEWDEALARDNYDDARTDSRGSVFAMDDWSQPKKHTCKKFWFAAPLEIAEKIKEQVPDHAGLYAISKACFGHDVRILKEAPVLKMAQKVDEKMMQHVLQCAYYRFWDSERKEAA